MFQPVDGNVNFPEQELAIGKFWKEHGIYEKSLAQRKGAPPFVFYEGPPTANGMPHPGHCLTRAIKDLFPRYQTMRGRLCERKAGWDTHGLPVEVEVCKELGIHSKEEIEAYGIEKFIQLCQQSVWRYMQEWRRLTERIGFWVDLDAAYVTYHQSYVESVWWSLKNLFDRGLLYQGHKIVWWWAQGGTALSAGEVGQGYRQVADPSVYVKFPLLDDAGKVTDTSLLVWTTTPWTLPSNQFAAVNPELEYVEVDLFREIVDKSAESRSESKSGGKSQSQSASGSGSKTHSWSTTESGSYRRSLRGDEERTRVIVTKELLGTLANKFNLVAYQIQATFAGSELVGKRYTPPFDYFWNRSSNKTGLLRPDIPDAVEAALQSRVSPEIQEKIKQKLSDPIHKKLASIQHAVIGGLNSAESSNHAKDFHAWRIIAADFVTTESGTGVVHQAPAFGEVDYDVLVSEQNRFVVDENPKLINAVAPDGKFTDEGPEYCRGRWVKDCDKDIIRDLKQRGLLFHQEQYVHDYPFCWRAEEDPLIQYPRESWFVRTTQFKDAMLANNAKINWLPEHIKDGRFGNFLESNVDWALSRERYWGTPLPIWKCSETGQMEAIGSYDELLAKPGCTGGQVWAAAKAKNPALPDDLQVHKPYIDAVTYDSPFAKGAKMSRVSEVIDCWYDSGAMPFAQWGYPHTEGSAERFKSQFPADFISEAIDQTRGWFYSLLSISTLTFSEQPPAPGSAGGSNQNTLPTPYPHPYRNCIVLGLMLGEDGQKMSKSKRNYLPPTEIFDKYGADALRWYFFANQPPWTSIRYSEQAIKDSIPEFLLRLWNVYSFFVIYANIDGFDPMWWDAHVDLPFAPTHGYRPRKTRNELDRWILSELNRTCRLVVERMDQYDNFAACQSIIEFVDALSNWYVRRSRDRFWAADKESPEKLDAYWTLYECLIKTAKLIAPFVPFVSETIWQNLVASRVASGAASAPESVHLADFPTANSEIIDESLSSQMNLVREISSLGRNARMAASLKVRQPLAKVEVVLADTTHQKWLESHADLIAEELNVKAVDFTTHGEKYISYSVVPNFKRLGPRLGKNMPAGKKLLAELDAAKLLSELKSAGKVALNFPDGSSIDLDNEDIEVRLQAKEGWAAAQGKGSVVVLSTELTPELVAEGLARDIVRLIQDQRKDIACDYTDRIKVGLVTSSPELARAINSHRDFIARETLASEVVEQPLDKVAPTESKLGGEAVSLYVQVLS